LSALKWTFQKKGKGENSWLGILCEVALLPGMLVPYAATSRINSGMVIILGIAENIQQVDLTCFFGFSFNIFGVRVYRIEPRLMRKIS
jgi:hypothetical protein